MISTWSRFYNSDILLLNVHEIYFEIPQIFAMCFLCERVYFSTTSSATCMAATSVSHVKLLLVRMSIFNAATWSLM